MKPFTARARLVVFLLFAFFHVLRADPAADFAEGNSALLRGDTTAAIQKYETLLRRGEIRAEVYCNLANAWQRAGDQGQALLNYERALLLNPSLSAARTGAAQVRLPGPEKWWDRLPALGANASIIALVVCGWIFLLCLTARWRRLMGTVQLWNLLAICAVFAAALIGVGFHFRDRPLHAPSRAIVLVPTKLRATFSDNSGVLTNLARATVVSVVSVNGPWTNCRLADGTQGWVDSQSVERVVPQPGGS